MAREARLGGARPGAAEHEGVQPGRRRARTTAASRGGRSSAPSTPASRGSAPSGSTSTSATSPIRRRRSRRRSAALDDLAPRGQAPLHRRQQHRGLAPGARRSGSATCAASRASNGCSRATACSTARPRPRCCRCAPIRASASRRSPRSAGGWLTGKYRRDQAPPAGSRMTLRSGPYEHLQRPQVFDALEALEAMAAERGVDMAALALAWLLAHPLVNPIVVGPRRAEHLAAGARGARAEARSRRRTRRAVRPLPAHPGSSPHERARTQRRRRARRAARCPTASRRWTPCCGSSPRASSTCRCARSCDRPSRPASWA